MKKICEWCGAEFVQKVNNQKFCSKECQVKYHLQKKRKASQRVCKNCGKKFKAIRKDSFCCSRACYMAAYRKYGPEKNVQTKRGARPMTPTLEHFFTAIAKYLIDKGVEFKDF